MNQNGRSFSANCYQKNKVVILNQNIFIWWKADITCYMLATLVSLQQRNVKKSKKSMKMVNIEGENLHIFWMTWGISMNILGKMWFMLTLQVIITGALPALLYPPPPPPPPFPVFLGLSRILTVTLLSYCNSPQWVISYKFPKKLIKTAFGVRNPSED